MQNILEGTLKSQFTQFYFHTSTQCKYQKPFRRSLKLPGSSSYADNSCFAVTATSISCLTLTDMWSSLLWMESIILPHCPFSNLKLPGWKIFCFSFTLAKNDCGDDLNLYASKILRVPYLIPSVPKVWGRTSMGESFELGGSQQNYMPHQEKKSDVDKCLLSITGSLLLLLLRCQISGILLKYPPCPFRQGSMTWQKCFFSLTNSP